MERKFHQRAHNSPHLAVSWISWIHSDLRNTFVIQFSIILPHIWRYPKPSLSLQVCLLKLRATLSAFNISGDMLMTAAHDYFLISHGLRNLMNVPASEFSSGHLLSFWHSSSSMLVSGLKAPHGVVTQHKRTGPCCGLHLSGYRREDTGLHSVWNKIPSRNGHVCSRSSLL